MSQLVSRPPVNVVEKPWGREIWLANNELYCGKLLIIRPWQQFSMHWHRQKTETFYLQQGRVLLKFIDTEQGITNELTLEVGDCVDILPEQPHQLRCISDVEAVIVEVSTQHFDSDSFRAWRGDR